jgi:hypothetical protein
MARRARTSKDKASAASPPPPPPPGLAGVERVRGARLRPRGDASIAGEMDRGLREMARLRREVGACAAAWAGVIPASLAARTRLVGLSRGVLTVAVSDAAARYALDRVLRSGAERAVAMACAAPVRKVRLVLAEGDTGEGARRRGTEGLEE